MDFISYTFVFTRPASRGRSSTPSSWRARHPAADGHLLCGGLAFSFLQFKGRNFIFMCILATMMVPWEATIIANYLTISSWGWLDTYRAMILPYACSAMGIF